MSHYTPEKILPPLTHGELRERINDGFTAVAAALNELHEQVRTLTAQNPADSEGVRNCEKQISELQKSLAATKQEMASAVNLLSYLENASQTPTVELEDMRHPDNFARRIMLAVLPNGAGPAVAEIKLQSLILPYDDSEIAIKTDHFRVAFSEDCTERGMIEVLAKGILGEVEMVETESGDIEVWGGIDLRTLPNLADGRVSVTLHLLADGMWKHHAKPLELTEQNVSPTIVKRAAVKGE